VRVPSATMARSRSVRTGRQGRRGGGRRRQCSGWRWSSGRSWPVKWPGASPEVDQPPRASPGKPRRRNAADNLSALSVCASTDPRRQASREPSPCHARNVERTDLHRTREVGAAIGCCCRSAMQGSSAAVAQLLRHERLPFGLEEANIGRRVVDVLQHVSAHVADVKGAGAPRSGRSRDRCALDLEAASTAIGTPPPGPDRPHGPLRRISSYGAAM
jgi:hypothetical protein